MLLSRRSLWIALIGLIALCCWSAQAAAGGRPSERVLPAETKGFLSTPSPAAFNEGWQRTQLATLVSDPQMKPFVDSFREQLKTRLTKTGKKLGVTWTDLEGVPGGEMATAIVAGPGGIAASVLLVDISGHSEQAAKLMVKVDTSLTSQGAKKSQTKISGYDTVTVYELPREKGDLRPSRAFHVIKDEMLVACDNADVLTGILGRWSGTSKDSLAENVAYDNVMSRAAAEAKGLAPHLRWFVEPFGLIDALRTGEPKPSQGKRDVAKALKNHGYQAIKGIGGLVNFSAGNYEVLHRTAIFAPPTEGQPAGEKYAEAARALDFPNSVAHQPPVWVPRELASFTSMNLRPAKILASSKNVINELANDPKTDKNPGFIDDILEGIAKDPSGPQVDIEKEIIANLGDHAVVVVDYTQPVSANCERVLLGIEARDAVKIAAALDRLMSVDKGAKQQTIAGVKVWVMSAPPAEEEILAPAAIVVMGGDGFVPVGSADEGEGADGKPAEDRFHTPDSAWAVAHGHLFRASHVDLLRRALEQAKSEKALADAVDYQTVINEMAKLGAGPNSFRFFSRTDEEARPTYELLRTGKMPESETMLARLLNRMLDDPKSLEPRKQKLDGSKLPSYDMVRRYLGPAGTFVRTDNDGWFITGFSLPKRAPIEVGMAPAK